MPEKTAEAPSLSTAYPVELALADPQVGERYKLLDDGRSVNEIWVGRDDGTATESWHDRTSNEDVLKYASTIPGWPEIMNRVIRTIPEAGITDYKFMWRDPLTQWASPDGRVLRLGDAAHTFIPSSDNGTTQAIEDVVCLAGCLQLGGKSNIPLAIKVHVKLRYDRVDGCQYMGFVNQETYQHTNWDAVAKNLNAIKAKCGSWIWAHDAEKYAYENYGNAFHSVVSGTPSENTNIPPGHGLKPWIIDELLELQSQGKPLGWTEIGLETLGQ